MGKVKELLYKEQNPQFDAEDAFDDYEPTWAGDEQLKEAMGNTEYESKLAELKADNEFLSFCKNALDSAYAEIKELRGEVVLGMRKITQLIDRNNELYKENKKLKEENENLI